MELKDIGSTPLIEIERLSLKGNKFFSKCEFLNPSGSHKDRTCLNVISRLEMSGAISPGMILVDCSTGNVCWVC